MITSNHDDETKHDVTFVEIGGNETKQEHLQLYTFSVFYRIIITFLLKVEHIRNFL